MCSVGDDVEDQENAKFMEEKPKFNLTLSICIKCRTQKPQIVLHNKYPYCKACFITGTVHKFKAVLGKNRIVLPNDTVLILHRPGHSGTALLQFLREGLDLITPKKLKFKPIILFVENFQNLHLEERKLLLEKIYLEIKHFNFECYFISLTEYALNPEHFNAFLHQDHTQIKLNENDGNELKNAVRKKCNETAYQELLNILERNLIVRTAKLLKCKSVFTPELAIDVASQLLTSISLGRGSHTAFDIGTVDTRDADVKILRPLRNFTIKELALYNVFNNLEPVSVKNVVHNPYSSVQNLMQKFVSDLQVNYPATVSTIVRTGDKLSVDRNLEQNEKCPLCKGPLENKLNTLDSAEATKFSHWVSTQVPDVNIPHQEYTAQLLKNFSNNRNGNHCFACSQIVNFL